MGVEDVTVVGEEVLAEGLGYVTVVGGGVLAEGVEEITVVGVEVLAVPVHVVVSVLQFKSVGIWTNSRRTLSIP